MFFKKSKPNHIYRIRYTQSFDIDNSDPNNIKVTMKDNDCVEMYIAALSISEAVSKLFKKINSAQNKIFISNIKMIEINN